MEKKKILIAVHRLSVGGVQKSLLTALDALDYDRFDVTLYVRKDDCPLLRQVNPKVGRIVVNRDPTRYYRKPGAILLTLPLRLTALAGRDPQKWQEKLDRFVIEGKMRYEQKHYFSDGTVYDAAVAYYQGYTAEFVLRCVPAKRRLMFYHRSVDEYHALHARLLYGFDRIVAVSESGKDLLCKLYPNAAEKITYLENHVDAPRIRADAQAYPIDRQNAGHLLCTCGRFSTEKGFDLALDAAKLLKEQELDYLWYFVGDGPDRAALEAKRAALGLENEVRMTGMLRNPYPYLAGCDVYIQPSREESYGLSVAEAQILLRPTVSTATAGGKSLIRDGETGLLTDFNHEDLAAKIGALLADAALRERLRLGLSRISYERKEKEYRAAWNALLSPEKEGP